MPIRQQTIRIVILVVIVVLSVVKDTIIAIVIVGIIVMTFRIEYLLLIVILEWQYLLVSFVQQRNTIADFERYAIIHSYHCAVCSCIIIGIIEFACKILVVVFLPQR